MTVRDVSIFLFLGSLSFDSLALHSFAFLELALFALTFSLLEFKARVSELLPHAAGLDHVQLPRCDSRLIPIA
jgi:hypothetical protein